MNLSRYNYNMIKADFNHNLWISLKSGLLQLNPENLNTVYYNFPVECLQTMEDGKILVTQNNGYLIIDPNKESSLVSTSQILINNFKTPTSTITNNHLYDTVIYDVKWSEKLIYFNFTLHNYIKIIMLNLKPILKA